MSILVLATLKKRPYQAGRGKVGKTPKPDRKKAAQAKRGGEKGKTFFGKKR